MNRLILFLFLCLSIVVVAPCANAQSAAKKQVAVYLTESDVEDACKNVIGAKMVAKITQSANYQALERTDYFLQKLRSARDYDTSGEVKDTQIARIGQQLGVKLVAVVDVSEVLGAIFVSARLINVETSAIIATSEEYSEDLNIQNLIALAEKVAGGLVLQGSSPAVGQAVSAMSGGEVETFTVNGVTFEMVKVEGGSFMMGSYSGDSDEQPVHSESVSTFYIGKTEVTQRLWAAVMGNNPSNWKGENLPVEMVSWYDCQEFCDRLSRLTGRMFRLPNEAEWEYAARGGNKSRGYEFSGSNGVGSVGWYKDNSGDRTHSVGEKFANELGIHDMTGNVWEWTADKYSRNYSSSRDSAYRVLRGGGWGNSVGNCRAALRGPGAPDSRYSGHGLRLAL